MRLATVRHAGRSLFGPVDDTTITDLSGCWASLADALGDGLEAIAAAAADAPRVALADVEFDLPIPRPERILCVGLNYHDHRKESAAAAQAGPRPTIFTRYRSSLVAQGQPIVRPHVSEIFDYEGELAVVIGRTARYVSADDALGYVAGYTIFQDGSVRDYQRHGGQFTPGKNFERSGSCGPWIVTADEFDLGTSTVTTRLNGQVMQHAPFTDLIFSVGQIIEYCSEFTTLEPGDIIATGTPGGVGYARTPPVLMQPGDVIEVEIDGIGVLSTPVVDE